MGSGKLCKIDSSSNGDGCSGANFLQIARGVPPVEIGPAPDVKSSHQKKVDSEKITPLQSINYKAPDRFPFTYINEGSDAFVSSELEKPEVFPVGKLYSPSARTN